MSCTTQYKKKHLYHFENRMTVQLITSFDCLPLNLKQKLHIQKFHESYSIIMFKLNTVNRCVHRLLELYLKLSVAVDNSVIPTTPSLLPPSGCEKFSSAYILACHEQSSVVSFYKCNIATVKHVFGWLSAVSSTFQDIDFDVSSLPLVINWC